MAAPTRVSTGSAVLAANINQYADRVNRQSTQTEVGKYFLASQLYTNGVVCSLYMPTLSRDATPASVAVDQADQAGTGGFSTTSNTAQLTASGFQIYTFAGNTGPNVNGRCGGNWTVTY